jgi:hypothetical protein
MLHGSFGSGESPFMTVLHTLLQGDVDARSWPELADTLAWHRLLGGKGASSSCLLPDRRGDPRGYVAHGREQHPDAALPAVYRAQELIDDGERRFFAV